MDYVKSRNIISLGATFLFLELHQAVILAAPSMHTLAQFPQSVSFSLKYSLSNVKIQWHVLVSATQKFFLEVLFSHMMHETKNGPAPITHVI